MSAIVGNAMKPERIGINQMAKPSGEGCVECLATGQWWLHLRRCAECGHIGCCDNSPNQHASKHGRRCSTIRIGALIISVARIPMKLSVRAFAPEQADAHAARREHLCTREAGIYPEDSRQ